MPRVWAPSLVLVFSATLLLHAQAGQQQPRPADDRDGNRFGASTPADPAAIERGRTLYSSGCAFCHGADARGAQGPDLARSLSVTNDEGGRILGEFLKAGRPANGMPPFPTLTAGDLADLSAFLKTRVTAARARPPMDPASIVVGNAMAGAAYFNGAGRCSTCHSPTGDFKGIGAKYNPVVLQGRMINPRVVGGGRGVTVPPPPPATVKVTMPGGQMVAGRLVSVNDFFVTLVDGNGVRRTIDRDNEVPKVEISDPLEAHRQQMLVYTDQIMHDLVAYLVTLK
jgi:cytochrome c oxidase cbb3-type subunit III